jgi:diguanylate cyclase
LVLGKKIGEQLASRAKLVNHAKLTVSIGAAMTVFGESTAQFISRADETMYKAKEAGKNRLAIAGESEEMIEFGG